jgi:hypothetical protein
MAEREPTSAERVRAEFHSQTAKVSWQDLQTHYARGAVVMVAQELDLVDVAMQLRVDSRAQFELWMAEGKVSGIADELAQRLFDDNPTVWAVVVPPWVLVQQRH